MKPSLLIAMIAAGIALGLLAPDRAGAQTQNEIARGRYLVHLGQCNDCHTAGYLPSNGQTPVKDWLLGGDLGFQGPWGTTWGPNLRLTVSQMSEAEWVKFARELKRRPPMGFWVLNTMQEADLKAIYAFIRSLKPVGAPGKTALAPGVQPPQPYFELHAPPPPAK